MNSVVESMEDPARRFLNTSVAGGADEGQLCSGTDLGKVILVPGLAALVEVDGVEKLIACRCRASPGAQVRDRQILLGRLREEQVPKGHPSEVRNARDVGEVRSLLPGEPLIPVAEPVAHSAVIVTTAALGPSENGRLHNRLTHAGTSSHRAPSV